MKSDRSNGHGLVDRGPRLASTLDMSAGRLQALDPGAKLDRRQLTPAERDWLNGVNTTLPEIVPAGAGEEGS